MGSERRKNFFRVTIFEKSEFYFQFSNLRCIIEYELLFQACEKNLSLIHELLMTSANSKLGLVTRHDSLRLANEIETVVEYPFAFCVLLLSTFVLVIKN